MSHITTYTTWVKFKAEEVKLLIEAMKGLGEIKAANDLQNITLRPHVGTIIRFSLVNGAYVPRTDTYGYEKQMTETMNTIQQRYKAAILGDILRTKGFTAAVNGTVITARRY